MASIPQSFNLSSSLSEQHGLVQAADVQQKNGCLIDLHLNNAASALLPKLVIGREMAINGTQKVRLLYDIGSDYLDLWLSHEELKKDVL